MPGKLLAVLVAGLVSVLGGMAMYGEAAADRSLREHRAPRSDTASQPANGAVRITFLGTTSLLLDDGETKILTDGFFSRLNAWRALTQRIETDTGRVHTALRRIGADRVRALFVVHSHYDHAFDAAYVALRTGATLHGSASTLNVGRGGELRDTSRLKLYEPGKELKVGRFRVTVLRANHSPPALPFLDDIGETIDQPLSQPARSRDYKEGGSYDLLIRHGHHRILIKPSANYIPGALDNVCADIIFLGVSSLGMQSRHSRGAYYDQTVGRVRPRLVVPIHWDDFSRPLSERLPPRTIFEDLPAVFAFLRARTTRDGIEFKVLQGYESVLLPSLPPPRRFSGNCSGPRPRNTRRQPAREMVADARPAFPVYTVSPR
jgi:L-ascorbate metabolism protein UlaG (beta-lactamase superfamily)